MTAPIAYVVQGRTLTLPMTIPRATSGVGVFTADAERIDAQLPSSLRPVRVPGGRALVALMLVDYVDNPLGDYDEGVVGFAARPAREAGGARGPMDVLRGRVGLWIAHMPVSQAFTREAGETMWGYPKTLDALDLTREGKRAALTWERDGQRILRFEIRAGGRLPGPTIRGSTYTLKDGVVHRTALTTRASGVSFRPRGARLELGDHRVGRGLAALDLSTTALASLWMERASMSFGPARPL